MRAVLELAGIRDVLAKSLGTTTPINMTRATVDGLRGSCAPRTSPQLRGKTIAEVLPSPRGVRRAARPQARGQGAERRGRPAADVVEAAAEEEASE